MVSFTSITQGIVLVSIVVFGSVEAAPAAGSKAATLAPHHNGTETSFTAFSLPPTIAGRTSPAGQPNYPIDLKAEEKSAEKNKKWFAEHGGNYTAIVKRDNNNVAGFTLDPPALTPPVSKAAAGTATASAGQVNDFKFHAAVASTAYCDTVVPKGAWSCTNCKSYLPDGKLIVTFSTKNNGIGGFVLKSDAKKTIYLVFRGTNSFQNWIVNLNFDLADYKPVSGAKVHKGFYNAYQEATGYFFNDIQAQIKANPGYKVVVTGHSLGGAQAVLAGMDLYQRISTLSKSNLSIYTVGCPRVGNPAFAYYVDSTGIPNSRSVHDRDLVPHVPPQSFGFLHPGVEAWERSSGTQLCTANIENDACSNSIVPFTSIDDHKVYYSIKEGTCV